MWIHTLIWSYAQSDLLSVLAVHPTGDQEVAGSTPTIPIRNTSQNFYGEIGKNEISIQSNFSGSNIVGTMENCLRHG